MKLHIYGDSFAAICSYDNITFSWANEVARRLDLRFTNHAVAGSSIEYSMIKFCQDISQKKIGPKDFIIFVHTNYARLNLNHFITNNPGLSCGFGGLSKKEIFSNPDFNYFADNYDNLIWYYNNLNLEVDSLHHQGFMHGIKNFAQANPMNRILYLKLDEFPSVSMPYDYFGFLTDLPHNLYYPRIGLASLSDAEFAPGCSFSDWQGLVGQDPRANHLTRPNLEILIDLATDSLRHQHVNDWHKDKFIPNLISNPPSLDNYLSYCERGLLWVHDNIVQRLKNVRV